jgi:hypothetical protein
LIGAICVGSNSSLTGMYTNDTCYFVYVRFGLFLPCDLILTSRSIDRSTVICHR